MSSCWSRQDSARCEALCAEYDGIYMDYSRQQATTDTMKLLFDFARKQVRHRRVVPCPAWPQRA